MKGKLILVIASTFPGSDADPVPAFVKDQVIALSDAMPDTRFLVLAPHNSKLGTKSFAKHKEYEEHRFHYFWPHAFEDLAGRGIVPSLKQNRFKYLLIPFFLLGEYFALKRLIEKRKPSLLYAHWFTPQAITASLLSRRFDIPFGYTSHASDVVILKRIPFGKSVVRTVTRRASFVTAVSRRTTEKLRNFFTEVEWKSNVGKKFAVIPMGVAPAKDQTTAFQSEKRFGLDSRKKNILFVGRLAGKKGVRYLIEGYKNLPEHAKNRCRLIIMGDGPLLEALEKQAANDSSIIFTGYLHGAEKREIFQLADLVCIPSIITAEGDSEGFPVVLMEALQMGKVIIATDESGAEEVIKDGKNGYIIPQKCSKAITDSIIRVLDLDNSKLRQLAKNSRTTGDIYEWPKIARQYKDIIDGVLGGTGA